MKRHLHRLSQLFLAVVIVILTANLGLEVANAGHRHGTIATCNTNPRNCRSTFVADNWMYVHVHDQFSFTSCQSPQWASEFDLGRVAWTATGGPQILDWGYSTPIMTWHYLNCSVGGWPVAVGQWGMNENCVSTLGCTNQAVPLNTEWSVAWFEKQDMAALGPSHWKWMFVHEFGHALGLSHHIPAGSNAVMVSQQLSPNTPSSIDIGRVDCSQGGVRCIYIWPWF
jgi:hypothetical protein